MQVRAVLFDLGGTLVKTGEIPQVIRAILQHHRIIRSVQETTRAWKKAERQLDFRDLTKLFEGFWVKWSTRILENLQVTTNTQRIAEFVVSHWWEYSDVALYPDAQKTLPILQQKGLKIGLVTNGLQSDVDQILPKAGIKDTFDAIVTIDTLGKMKPDVEMFHHALNQLKTSPSEAVFVGDEVEADYGGATKSGLLAFLIDREGRIQEESLSKLSSLENLLELDILR